MTLTEDTVEQAPRPRVKEVDFFIRHRNEGAAADLVIPVYLLCNTPDHILIEHVKANSALQREWIKNVEPHDGVAVICGSGPSLGDNINAIRALERSGGTIFAMNGSALFLDSEGILPHYQVIADAQERTAKLVGPACNHIFASQVHPSLFDRVPGAKLFHVNFYEGKTGHEEFLKLIEGVGPSQFALIGSHGSVGNVSLALAYAMGFREIHVFGFDSSFRGDAGHAFSQPMNAEEPVVDAQYDGKDYKLTFTMKSQADVFPRIVYELEEMGAKFFVYGDGYLPDRWRGERAKTLEDRERDKYAAMWDYDAYRLRSPGTEHVIDAILKLGIEPGDSLIDFGCGTGRATKLLRDGGVDATGVDLVPSALETDVPFVEACLWFLPAMSADWGFCCDVMEHMPTEKVADVLAGIAASVKRGAFFAIDSGRDDMGQLIGHMLHLTVRHPAWWERQLKEHFASVEQYEDGVFVCRHA